MVSTLKEKVNIKFQILHPSTGGCKYNTIKKVNYDGNFYFQKNFNHITFFTVKYLHLIWNFLRPPNNY